MKFAIIVLVVVIAVLGGVAALVGPSISGGVSFGGEPEGIEVRTAEATEGDLVETVKAPGKLEPHTKVEISAEVSARIEQLPFREGDEVRRGDLIVKLDDRDLQAALESANARRDSERFRLQAEQARLEGLTGSLDFANRQLERKRSLYETGDISRQELDDVEERAHDLSSSVDAARYNISVIESQLAAAGADIERAQDALEKTVIVAPMDGVVTVLNAEVGELVMVGTMNNAGTVILTIADLSRMLMKAEVAETDIVKVDEDRPAVVHVNAYPDEPFTGVVRRVALQRTDRPDGSGHFKTEIEIDLRGRRLPSGLLANADIEIARHHGIVVPSQAIVDREVEKLPDEIVRNHPLVDRDKRIIPVVYRIEDGRTVCTPVIVGPSDESRTVVRRGLDAGAVVIDGPYKVLETIGHDEAVRAIGANDEKPAEAVADDAAPEAADETGAAAAADAGTSA